MSETYYVLKPVRKEYLCDECDVSVEHDGTILASQPPQYPHNCPNCGERYTFSERYPRIEFVKEEDINVN